MTAGGGVLRCFAVADGGRPGAAAGLPRRVGAELQVSGNEAEPRAEPLAPGAGLAASLSMEILSSETIGLFSPNPRF